MTDHYIDERKRYIAEVKKSFQTSYGNSIYQDDDFDYKEEASSFSSFKFKFMIAIFLFCLYLYCDYTGTKVGQYTTRDIVDTISENEFYQKLENYVMIEMSQE